MGDAEWLTESDMSWRVRQFETVTSTNSLLLEAGLAGEVPGLVYVADVQTQGRGRLDRTWSAAAGDALLVSVLLQPVVEVAQLATRAMALAVLDTCNEWGADAELKWPNDVVVGDAKIAGVLGESTSSGGALAAVVVGCGLNLRAIPPGLAGEATFLAAHAVVPVERSAVLTQVLGHLDGHLRSGRVPAEFAERCSTVGRLVSVERAEGRLEGVAVSVSPTGDLEVRADGRSTFVSPVEALRTRHLPSPR